MSAQRSDETANGTIAKLTDLNSNYIRSVEQADVEWFRRNLSDDFMNTNPDGTLIDKAAFLAQIARGSAVQRIAAHDVMVRLLGGFAIIHARTTYVKPDGSIGEGRYTDDWQLREGTWQCVSAHVTRR